MINHDQSHASNVIKVSATDILNRVFSNWMRILWSCQIRESIYQLMIKIQAKRIASIIQRRFDTISILN